MTMTQLRAPAPETVIRIQAALAEVAATGLCGTCDARPSCVLRSGAGRSVWDCSEYSADPGTVRTARPLPSADDADAVGDALGLCVNCDLLLGCTLRASGQTVLRCEEYR